MRQFEREIVSLTLRADSPSSLRLDQLTKRRRASGFTLSVSATFATGTTAVIGQNGSGKSTLLRLLATADKPDAGTYLADDVSVLTRSGTRALRDRLGWLPQTFGYEPSATVSTFLKYVVWMRGLRRSDFQSEPDRVLELVGLSARKEDSMRSLSGGMLRRVGIASALIGDPDVLVLDEPTAGLDTAQRENLYSILREVSNQRIVIISTHIVEDVAKLADHEIFLENGQIDQAGLSGAPRIRSHD